MIGEVEVKQPQKLKMPDPDWMRQAMALADLVLIEADGSKRLPCKVPATHEPVILPETEVVIAVLGLSALEQPLKECCFRLEEAEKLLEADADHLLSCEDMAKILASEEGLRKDVGGRKYVAVLNQCDDDTRREGGTPPFVKTANAYILRTSQWYRDWESMKYGSIFCSCASSS